MSKLGFADIGNSDYPEYLILKKDNAEVHFFLFKNLVPTENYGQLYFWTGQGTDAPTHLPVIP
ncbi:VOC family protein [Chryseobacterium koreense]|uniref:hypothetical protein n=1 Tax=Chryseobacterium koreense TaxID=232216 RepID=UPI000B136A18|nr:hypothetical protein [Chryseobacterium koreense]MBB5332557.1 hypothetical protein [Chryseobacterium koreense]